MIKINNSINNFLQNKLISNMGIIFIYNSASYLLVYLTLIISARIWGPEKYGKLVLVGSLCSFLYYPFSLGVNNSMYKLLPQENSNHNQLISSAFTGTIFSVLFFSMLSISLYSVMIKNFNISFQVWYCAIIYATISTLIALSESFLRGKKKFSLIGRIRLLSSAIFFIIFILLIYVYSVKNITYYYIAFSAAFLIFVILILINVRFSFKYFNFISMKNIFKYGIILMSNMLLTTILFNSDLLLINYFYSSAEVGVYASFQGIARQVFFVLFYEVFLVVYLPSLANQSFKEIHKKFKKNFVRWLFIIVLFIFIVVSIFNLIYGKEYKYNFLYVLLTSLSIAFFTMFQLLNYIISLKNIKTAKITLTCIIILVLFSELTYITLIKNFALMGGMITSVISNFAAFLILYVISVRLIQKNNVS